MAVIDDFKAAQDRSEQTQTALLTAINNKLATFGDVITATDAQALIARVNAVSDKNAAETTALSS